MPRTREQHRLYMQAYRKTVKSKLWHAEYEKRPKIKAYRKVFQARYRQTDKAKVTRAARLRRADYQAYNLEYQRRYRAANPERFREYARRHYAAHRKPRSEPLPEVYPFLAGDGQGEEHKLLMAVHSMVPRLYEELRREVCQDALVMVLSKVCTLRELPERMQEIIAVAQRRIGRHWGTVYLSEERFEGKSWGETLG